MVYILHIFAIANNTKTKSRRNKTAHTTNITNKHKKTQHIKKKAYFGVQFSIAENLRSKYVIMNT